MSDRGCVIVISSNKQVVFDAQGIELAQHINLECIGSNVGDET